jgi:hypothetical protein
LRILVKVSKGLHDLTHGTLNEGEGFVQLTSILR